MEKERILQEILTKYTNIDYIDDDVRIKYADEKILGRAIGGKPVELALAFIELEHIMGVKIPNEFIFSNKFDTYNNILDIIRGL